MSHTRPVTLTAEAYPHGVGCSKCTRVFELPAEAFQERVGAVPGAVAREHAMLAGEVLEDDPRVVWVWQTICKECV